MIKMAKNKVRVSVNGIQINLLSDEKAQYVFSIAAEVEDAIKKVKSENPGLSQSIVDILVMMDFCDKLRKAKAELEGGTNFDTKKAEVPLKNSDDDKHEKLKNVNKKAKNIK